ncbi:hypothetical protein BDV98DRAFT_552896 [Pterulicium gracile]|uniref:Uncharacterized protein n=1 Tax=Pterulicium gracile TaxID=1884261 RepID=A0A5C3QAY0_9AGAR|nr:hypothetical protein BDV98DRAFT_552896 [Pterula gracilis]
MPDPSQYAPTTGVPLIQSPSLRVQKPVTLPPDIHPLPENITAYFVYPFTLEPHVLDYEASRQANMKTQNAMREATLLSREEDKARRKREALRKVAPGFEPQSGPLVPTRASVHLTGSSMGDIVEKGALSDQRKSVMEDVVDQLAALDASR